MTNITPTYGRPAGNHSIQPASGYYGISWPSSGAIPQSFSAGGWTSGNLGYAQQTFLGASIRSFNLNGGFGDTSSQLSVELINDDYNKSDGTPKGMGDDAYHNGQYDTFAPPPVGSPVFFKFGENIATVEEAYKKTFDDLYNTSTMNFAPQPRIVGTYNKNNFTQLNNGEYVNIEQNTILDNSTFLNSQYRGKNHLTFGGILQSYVQNRGPAGNPLYSVQVVDPREILANTTLILNNYAGTIFKNANMFNIYGFLEYNPTETLQADLDKFYPNKSILTKTIVETGTDKGSYSYSGYDLRTVLGVDASGGGNFNFDLGIGGASFNFSQNYPIKLPITGTGFSRRGAQGIPYYRLRQGLNSLLGVDGLLPQEYKDAGFGSYINFRGFNYVVDLDGLKEIKDYYFFDFDQINLLDLCLEICDITSSDLFVTLLPVIDHPVSKRFYDYNQIKMKENKPKEIIAGIIRVDAIDRSRQPEYGAIKKYIDSLSTSGIYVENQDVGFELSNVTTDKFIVGAQEIDMYYFSANADRDELEVRKQKAGDSNNKLDQLLGGQWKLETSLKQQILPYYGLLGNHSSRVVTIPRGFGAYQQILLDSTSLNANGVGNYYVATEMELRASLISYERWAEFLGFYNNIYLESLEDDDAYEGAALRLSLPENAPPGAQLNPVDISNEYGVTVPRSVFDTYQSKKFGDDDLPASPCNPPYGYPLYYKRASKIGIQTLSGGGGLTQLQASYNSILTNLAALQNASDADFGILLNSQWTAFQEGTGPGGIQNDEERAYYDWIKSILDEASGDPAKIKKENVLALIEGTLTGLGKAFKILNRLTKKTTENSRRVYNFIRQIADECLGKKFLVKIPKDVNLWYASGISIKNNTEEINEYEYGPFGFKPRSINYDPHYEYSTTFTNLINQERNAIQRAMMESFLSSEADSLVYSKFKGALDGNWNPISETHEFNYVPSKEGGFINFDLFENTSNGKQIGVKCGIVPQDSTNFINDNHRMTAYVRFDNSQYLSFDGISQDSFVQQKVVAGDYVPDITYELNNTRADDFISFPNNKLAEKTPLEKTVAFVKCDVDDKLYLIPKTSNQTVEVHGRKVQEVPKLSKPNKIYDCATNTYKNSFQYYTTLFTPKTESDKIVSILDFEKYNDSQLGSEIIETREKNLDTNHVYALITLPNRISPTKDARFRDAQFQEMNADRFKHLASLDVVKGLAGFDEPAYNRNAPKVIDGIKIDDANKNIALSAHNAAMKGLEFSLPQRTGYSSPSPVYPDLVALPLMSKERCYGPWVSSQIDSQAKIYQNITGKVEFLKDENLAPWNYNGYQLMNAAGILQAEFSNSLLLQTERGGFVVPSAPFGVTLGKALLNSGPLVTNLSVDISDAGIKTTCKMDLYTAKFGKLQKQKQDLISKISRERQKLQDERNALIRKGLGKNATQTNYINLYKSLGSLQGMLANDGINDIFNQNEPQNVVVGSINSSTNVGHDGSTTYGAIYGNASNQIEHQSYSVEASYQSPTNLSNTSSAFPNAITMARALYRTAGQSIQDSMAPFVRDVSSPYMSAMMPINQEANQKFYDDDGFNPDDLTTLV
jgi:hypothetical protein